MSMAEINGSWFVCSTSCSEVNGRARAGVVMEMSISSVHEVFQRGATGKLELRAGGSRLAWAVLIMVNGWTTRMIMIIGEKCHCFNVLLRSRSKKRDSRRT